MSERDGGSAFPLAARWDHREFEGMSLRDYFAGQAIHGLISFPDLHDRGVSGCAAIAYEMADAMLKERSK